MPLYFQDKLNVLEKYLLKAPKQQLIFLQYLDELCAKNFDIIGKLR